jgi:hypothetical protein
MGLGQMVRVGVVLASVVFAAASATAPKPKGSYKFERSRTVKTSVDAAWTALIDTFADRDWAIDKLDKASGIITTDWMSLTSGQADEFADCGSAPLATTRSQVRFNVTVREVPTGAAVVVNTTFRQLRQVSDASGVIDCTSKGVVETIIHESVAARAKPVQQVAKTDANMRKTVTGENPLYCAVTTPDVGLCYQSEAACTASLTEGAAACEVRAAGSCFTATKQLDQTKTTTCAVSIKDCEARHAVAAADPDLQVTACGIYRAAEKK